MDPKRLLLILFPFVTLILVGLSMLIFNVVQQYRSALEKENIADQIVTDVFERRLVGYEYLVTPGERAAAQWFARQEALEKFVVQKEPLFQLPEEKQQLTVVKSALQESRATFEAVVRTFTAADSGSPALQGQKARFSSQLTIKSEESVSAAARLKTLNAAGAEKALGRVLNLFLLASATFMVVLLVCFAVVWHNATVLERRKARDDAILGSVGDGVFAVDPNGRVILFNRAAQTLTGYTYAEAIGKPYDKILSFYHEQTGEKADAFIQQALSGKTASMAKHTMLKQRAGGGLPVADSAAPIIVNNEALGAVVVFRDTTNERQIERMKDEFLSVASHELRTPMGAIRANLSMILAGDYGKVNTGLVEPLTDMRTSTTRLVELVNDLLDVTRIEAGRLKFTLAVTDVNDVARQVVHNLAPLAAEKGIALKVQAGKAAVAQMDPAKVTQVLTNLVGNSLKFTSKGGIVISVHQAGEFVMVEVADTGIGISPADQKRLFAKFQQIENQSDGKPVGTGLGLYISREIIRKMGGDLSIKESRPGKGSTFAFTLPTPDSAAGQKAKAAISREAQSNVDQK